MAAITRWARFRSKGGADGFGVLEGDRILVHEGDMFAGARPTGESLGAQEYSLLAPCAPSKIIALWNNFHALAAKLGKQPPSHPLLLIKPSTSVIGPDEPIRRPAGYSGKILYEGELAIVIGRRASSVPVSEALAHVFGYTCVNDVTAAEILTESADFTQWCRAKGFDTFGCLGPVIATGLDWGSAQIATTLDGVERQRYSLSDMIFTVAELVSRISQDMSLLPGDVIACGTSLGVGSIKDGSRVEVRIDGIGSLVNTLTPGS